MKTILFIQAIQDALDIAMGMDENIFIAGEGIATSIHNNPFRATHGLIEKYGSKRVKDTPVCEAAIAGLGVGASAMGLKPVIEIMFFPFITLASDMLVNHAAKLRYLSGGKMSFPLTVRVKEGIRMGAGSHHSHNLEAWLAHVPGLKIVIPATPEDAKGLLLTSIFDPNPVIFIEDLELYRLKGEVPEGDFRVPFGKARIARAGSDVTIVSYGSAVETSLRAAEKLVSDNIKAEVIDLRTLVPLDRETIINSVKKTGRLVIVHDATKFCGFGAEISAIAADEAFEFLKAPVKRVAAYDIPVPVSPPQQNFNKPDPSKVISAVKEIIQ